ncbi:hypothetical protein ASC80_07365 [Afipia sp. Root123D2]|uniref:hypothetical protein n=1 Tax=Afipia sp. Root123D2 TaxID=1736436 RepID=UPI0006F70260|nr:hypothetical protein [Afipia sp. Root123D2]KQW23115.1 hypothetical protein ASC80_07365 [Afipia sp. Root123D2]
MSEAKKTGAVAEIKCSRQYWTYGADNPKSIKAERNIAQLAEWDDRLTPAARKVLDFMIDWEHDARGDSLASLRHIVAHLQARAPEGCAIAKRTVENGIACLLHAGWIVRTFKGTGQKNASRYVVPADILANAALGHMPTVPDVADGLTVPDVGDSTVPDVADGLALTVPDVADKDTTTKTRLPDAAMSSSNDSDGAATPPLADGLAATAAETPPGFESFWNSYAHKQKRKDAKAAWGKLVPDAELAATIVSEAGRWAAHYVEHNVEPRWRVLPHNWLAGENWLQDLPIIHTDAKSAAISKTRGSGKANAPTKAKAGKLSKATHAFAEGETLLTIIKADVVKGAASSTLAIVATDETGVEYNHTTFLEHHNSDTQEAGQRELGDIVRAAGLSEIEDSKVLHGLEIVAVVEGGKLEFTAPLERKPKPESPTRTSRPLTPAEQRACDEAYAAWCAEQDAA